MILLEFLLLWCHNFSFSPGRIGRPVQPILSAIFSYFSNFALQNNPILCSVLTTFSHLENQPTYLDAVWVKGLFMDLFLSYHSRKIMGQPVQPSPKFLGQKWSYQLPQASLKQFSVVLVHFLILNFQLKISQKQVHRKSLYSDCVNICQLIFLLWTLETPIDHPDAKKWSKLNILWGFFEVQNC